MQRITHYFATISFIFILVSCGSSGTSDSAGTVSSSGSARSESGVWSVPVGLIRDGGPGKDGIPALRNPRIINANQSDLADNELVTGVVYKNVVRAYPHNILNWHEIVNETYLQDNVVISLCPLTGSSMGWHVGTNLEEPYYGVSGLLYESNLILFDRETDSHWSQMLKQGINGSRIDEVPQDIQVVETTWGTWKAMYPDTDILSENTGFTRDYHVYPYGNFRTDTRLIFSVQNFDQRLHPKERVLGIRTDDTSRVYPLENFSSDIQVINDSLDGEPVVIVGSSDLNFAVAFKRMLDDGTVMEFSHVNEELPIVMQDEFGTSWDVFGRAVAGEREGSQLEITDSYIAYWFAWAAFHNDAEIYEF